MRSAPETRNGIGSVLLVTDGDPRIQPTLADFAETSAERGVRVTVASPGESREGSGGEWAADLQRRVAPDVVHVAAYQYASLPWHAPVVLAPHRCPLSERAALHGEVAEEAIEDLRRALGRATVVVLPTRSRLRELNALVGAPRAARVIHEGRRAAAPAATRADPRKEPLVLAVGTLGNEASNLDAVASVARSSPWPVVLAGPHACEDFGLHAWLTCVDIRRDPIDAWAARASLAVFPDRYDFCGLAPLDAARRGCALLLADIPCYRELWSGAACFFPVDNRRALAGALDAIAANPAMAAEYGDLARARAEHFDATRMVDDYLALYAELRQQPLAA